MNSYASIFKYLNEYVLQYLKDVEAEWRVYFSAEQSDAKRMEIVRNTINHNKFTINVIEKDKQDLIRGQQKVRKMQTPMSAGRLTSLQCVGGRCTLRFRRVRQPLHKHTAWFAGQPNCIW